MKPPQIISVRLTPKASSNRIGGTQLLPSGDDQLMVYVTEVPEGNKANDAMIDLLAKHFKIATSRLTIARGRTSRNKVVSMKKKD